MVDKNTIIKVTNRSYGSVGYEIQDLGIRRTYESGEVKEITMEELTKLSYSSGGKKLIEKYLVIDNPDAVSELLGEVEPEYFYTEDDVKNLLLNGSLDQLYDCLDFANAGVIDLVKNLAVKLEINDVSKRKAILEKTGFDVDNAILVNHETEEADAEEEAPSKRRAAPMSKSTTTENSGRRTAAPKYKVTSNK